MPFWSVKDAGKEEKTKEIFARFGFEFEKDTHISSDLPGWRRIFVNRYLPEELKAALKEAGIYLA